MLTSATQRLFPLEKDTIYLDHGGFGVTPMAVLEAANQQRERIEKNPRKFLDLELPEIWKNTAAMTAQRFSAQAGDVALIENTTDGINGILRSLHFQPDDEILVLSAGYGAISIAAKHIAQQFGAHIVEAQILYPSPDPQQCVEAVRAAITSRVKVAIFDHITSKTALVLPIEAMVRVCREKGIAVVVDGAHAPGQVALDIPAVGADWYVGNLHKWSFVPRGCGLLWARPERQMGLAPAVLSWEAEKPFPASFSWTGTRDASILLSIPAAFRFVDELGEENIRSHNHALAVEAMRLLSKAWSVPCDTPECMIGSMVLLPLPTTILYPATEQGRMDLHKMLVQQHQITCPCIVLNDRLHIRVSAQIYNEITHYEALALAINSLC